jgi:flagellar basal-body rod protein FlgC
MVSAINAALSGLSAAEKKLEVHGKNIANVNSTKSLINGQVVNQPYLAQQVDQISLSTGGVLALQSTSANPTQTIFSPGDPAAAADGTVLAPNVDLADEMVGMILARSSFRANLDTIKVQDRITQSLLNIIS